MKRIVMELFVALFCIFNLISPSIIAKGHTVADRGKTCYTIILSSEANETEIFAANELVKYLKEITGTVFNISTNQNISDRRIIVGDFSLSRSLLGDQVIENLGNEDFILKMVDSDLVFVGGGPRGTLYAVYSFLEKELGVRWFNWIGEKHFPNIENFTIKKLERSESPAFAVRDMYYAAIYDRPIANSFMGTNRINGPYSTNFFDNNLIEKFGGFNYKHTNPLVHSFFYYIPPTDYFEEHQDFFSLINGKRVARQLCFSNSELKEVLTRKIKEKIESVGGVGVFSVSAQDTPGELCQCDECKKLVNEEGTPGAPLFKYIIELSENIEKEYPKAYISTLAYRLDQSEKPPLNLMFPDNVIIIFAPIDNNFAKPFEHSSNSIARENLLNWERKCKNLWIWYYPNPYTGAATLPIGNYHKTIEDFRFFKRIGVNGIWNEHDAGIQYSHRLADLQTWLLLQIMWDPNQDLDYLINDFTGKFYGEAAPFMQEFINNLENATQMMDVPLSWNPAPGEYRFLTPEFLLASQNIFDNAEASVENNSLLLFRVRQARMSLDAATILFWNNFSPVQKLELNKEQIAERYRSTYNEVMITQVLPEYRGSDGRYINYVENFLKYRMLMTDLKPLPAQFDQIPEERIRQVTPDFANFSGGSEIIVDLEAASGIALTKETGGELPFTLGFYDAITGRQIHKSITAEEITTSGYNIYKIGRTKLNSQCRIWVTRSWHLNFSLSEFYLPNESGQQWDIYASLRFEGPSYPNNEEGEINRVFVDRIILVKFNLFE